jgi:hypothetical protein
MASSYTDLGLELMVTGENSGTWGDKTNTNLELIQQGFAGYQEVTVNGTGTTTLAITDGTISNGRNAVIKLIGTITGNIIVTIPDSIEKIYVFENGTTGAFTVQVKTVSGTGPTFSATEKNVMLVYSNGTDIVEMSNQLAGQVIGTDIQAYDAELSAIAALATTDSNFIVGNGSTWVAESGATARTSLGVGTGNDVQFDSFGVGTAASGTTGEIRATNDVTAFYSSDVALKENIVNIPNPLEAIKKLNGVLFDWKKSYMDQRGGEDGYFVRKKDVGVIAQEVEKVLPEAVAQRPDGIKAVKYDRLTCLLIEAVKVLSDKIQKIEEKR